MNFGDFAIPYRPAGLNGAFETFGSNDFAVYAYSTEDRLEEVLAAGYFQGVSCFRPGDMIWISSNPRTKLQRGRNHAAQPDMMRRALIMVRGRDDDRTIHTRLVQDFGGPMDANAELHKDESSRKKRDPKLKAV